MFIKIMRTLLTIYFLCLPLLAEEPKPTSAANPNSAVTPPAPARDATTDALRGEIETLKAQLYELQVAARWDLIACRQPDLMQARLATIAAQEKAKAAAK
jgi:hypothetical protein